MTQINTWRKAHFLASDMMLAILVAGMAVGLLCYTSLGATIYGNIKDNAENVYRTTASLAGALMGFSMTVTVLALNLWQTRRWFDVIKSEGETSQQLWTTLKQTTWFLAFLTATSLTSLLLSAEDEAGKWILMSFLTVLSLTSARILRSIWIINRMTEIAVAASRGADTTSNG